MFYITRLINRKQSGFTFIELSIAMLVTAIISVGVIAITTQLLTAPMSYSARLTAVMQVDDAIDAITRDAMQAKTISVNTPGDFLYVTWLDYGTGVSNYVTYTIDSTAKTLLRSQNGETAIIIARNVDSAPSNTWCTLSGNALTLNFTSKVTASRPTSETRQVQILRRPT